MSTPMDSAAPCAFDWDSSGPSSDEEWFRGALGELQLPSDQGGAPFSSVPPPAEAYFQGGGDATLDDFLVALNKDLRAPPPSMMMDDHFSRLPLPVSAQRRWPVVAPNESIGVNLKEGTWEAHIWLKDFNIERSGKSKEGMQFFVGSFETKDEAKWAHDKAAIMLNVRVSKIGNLYSLNYPEEQYTLFLAEHADWSRRDKMWKMRRESKKFNKGTCVLKGVGWKASGYSATISVTTTIHEKKRKITMVIGHFQTEDDAGREYDKALLFIKGAYDPGCITNFRPSSYSAEEVQEVGERLAVAYGPRVNFQELRRKHSEVFA